MKTFKQFIDEAVEASNSIKGLSNEHKQKLTKIKPSTLGQAQRIDGITPSAIGLILSHMKNRSGANTDN